VIMLRSLAPIPFYTSRTSLNHAFYRSS
jgi:hypothetical protein